MTKLIPILTVFSAVFVNYAIAQEQVVEVLAQSKQNETVVVEEQPLSLEEQPLSVEQQQLQQLQQQRAAEKLKAQQRHLHTLVQFCAPCHGVNGVSAIDIYPNLAGQQQEYLAKQLRDFKSKARVDAVMNGLVKRLNQNDIQMLAEYYASLVVKKFAAKIAEPSAVTESPVVNTNDDIPVETGEQNEG